MEKNTNCEMSMDDINKRISNEICYETIKQLLDENLMDDYKNCNSVKKQIVELSSVMQKNDISEEKIIKIVDDYLVNLIPPGTKGVIRGNKFNNIIKQFIKNMKLNEESFEISFEKKCDAHFTTEIPDWYILEKKNNKTIIGMNQLDLWSGGQQLNRGSKYLENNKHNSDNCKLLCVVCNNIQFKSKNSKAYKLVKLGFENNTLCYLNNLQNIINSYFELI